MVVKVARIEKKPIIEAFEKIAELKLIIKRQADIQKKMLAIILDMDQKLDKLTKEKEEKEKAREGWFY
tara:strand:- start:3 stop:206 length:204 start_codon:yes stop_codon:yes gene_type:complete